MANVASARVAKAIAHFEKGRWWAESSDLVHYTAVASTRDELFALVLRDAKDSGFDGISLVDASAEAQV